MNLSDLKKPFPKEDVEWRIARSGMKNGKPWGQVLAYITNRAIMDRLDEVCGQENWKNDFKQAPEGGVLCGISVKIEDEWVTKWDGADKTQIEAVKGGLSGAMKRAGSQWGIGRYLYNLDSGWADFNANGIYNAKVKDQNGKESWHKWNAPLLPEWALPEGSGAGMKKPDTPTITPKEQLANKMQNAALTDEEQKTFEKWYITNYQPPTHQKFLTQKGGKELLDNFNDLLANWREYEKGVEDMVA